MAVADIVLMSRQAGSSPERIAEHFNLELSAIHAAIAYHYDHREEIDRQMSEEGVFLQAERASAPSKLRANRG